MTTGFNYAKIASEFEARDAEKKQNYKDKYGFDKEEFVKTLLALPYVGRVVVQREHDDSVDVFVELKEMS